MVLEGGSVSCALFWRADNSLFAGKKLMAGCAYVVCDWWHGLPQLFWKNVDYPEEANYPSSCAEVNLVAQEP